MFLDSGSKEKRNRENPCAHRENVETPHSMSGLSLNGGQIWDLLSQVTVLPTHSLGCNNLLIQMTSLAIFQGRMGCRGVDKDLYEPEASAADHSFCFYLFFIPNVPIPLSQSSTVMIS